VPSAVLSVERQAVRGTASTGHGDEDGLGKLPGPKVTGTPPADVECEALGPRGDDLSFEATGDLPPGPIGDG